MLKHLQFATGVLQKKVRSTGTNHIMSDYVMNVCKWKDNLLIAELFFTYYPALHCLSYQVPHHLSYQVPHLLIRLADVFWQLPKKVLFY